MSVSGVSGALPSSIQSQFTKPRQDLESLQSDLKSGNLAGAQKDFASFQQDISGLLPSPPSGTTGLQQASSDFKTLQSDLNSGDLTAAQKDFSTILQELQSAGGHHKHHHHSHLEKSEGDAASTSTGSTGTAASANSGMPEGLDYRAIMAAYAAFTNPGTSGTSINTSA